MAEPTPLQRAHALSAQASLLLRPSQSPPQTLHQALDAYKQAAELFEQSCGGVGGDAGAKKTLELLTVQHRKLAKDVERRIRTKANQLAQAGQGGRVDQLDAIPTIPPRSKVEVPESRPDPSTRQSSQVTSPVQPSETPSGWSPLTMNGIITDQVLATSFSISPFSFRPSLPYSQSAPLRRQEPSASSQIHTLSPLHSSSSSSDAPDESYLHLDTLDPFSRFWGALETMLEDISNPVAFASAPVDLPGVDETLRTARQGTRGKRKESSGKEKGKGESHSTIV